MKMADLLTRRSNPEYIDKIIRDFRDKLEDIIKNEPNGLYVAFDFEGVLDDLELEHSRFILYNGRHEVESEELMFNFPEFHNLPMSGKKLFLDMMVEEEGLCCLEKKIKNKTVYYLVPEGLVKEVNSL